MKIDDLIRLSNFFFTAFTILKIFNNFKKFCCDWDCEKIRINR